MQTSDSITMDTLATAQPSVPAEASDVFPHIIHLVDTMIWPVVLLVILWFFNKEFKGIFKRLQSIEATSTGLKISTFEKNLDRIESISDTIAEVTGTSKTMKAPPDPFGPSDPKMKVAKVQLDLDKKLRKKAISKNIEIPKSTKIDQLAFLLKKEGALSKGEYVIVEGLIELAENVMKGYDVTDEQAETILDIYSKLP